MVKCARADSNDMNMDGEMMEAACRLKECSGVAPVEGGSYLRKNRCTGSVVRKSIVRLLKAFKARLSELELVDQ